jgi:hypothetical protein
MSNFSQQIKHSNTDEWLTQEKDVQLIVPALMQRGYDKILCPFDKENSAFVTVLNRAGFKVTHGHLENGQDFFERKDLEQYDAIVSNPPFSKRQRVFERLFESGKPFAMITNFNGLFDAKSRWALFKENKFELLIPRGRMKFSNAYGVQNSPNFQAIYVCSKMFDCQINFTDGANDER